LATQNPVEQEGTYPLPEAQLDRFMLKVVVGYNTAEEEVEVVKRVAGGRGEAITQVANKDDIFALQKEASEIHIDDALIEYIVNIINATREPEKFGLEDIKEYIDFGASPRASINIYKASKAYALINGKDYVTPLDIAQIAPDVLRHRIILNYKAVASGISVDSIIQKVLKAVPLP